MLSLVIASFFSSVFWGSRWGLVDAFHRTPHKGLDVVHPARTPVPVLRSGRVVADLPSSSVGRYIVIEVGPNDFDVYCHVVTRGLKGWVTAGTTLCYLAGYGDSHGSAWTGPHLHLCRATTRTGWAYWGPQNRNPETLIRAILGTQTGGITATTTLVLTQKGDTMNLFHIPAGLAGGPAKNSGNNLYIAVGPDGFYWEFLSSGKKGSTAGNLASQCGGSSAAVTSAQRDQLKAMCASIRNPAVATIDEAALAAALGPLLVSDADLASAVKQIKAAIPTTFTAG